MPEIEVRPAIASDINILIALDHHYTSDHVWQMEFQHNRENHQIEVNFRQVRLPRNVRVEYPRSPRALVHEWQRHSGLLVATMDGAPIGYSILKLDMLPGAAWVTDLVVERSLRRKGIGTALALAASEWALHMDCNILMLEMQPKNHPAIQMALKLGFEFCGYNDRHYHRHGLGIYFFKSLG